MGGTGNSMCKVSDMGPSLVGVRNGVTWRHRGDVKSVACKAAVAIGTGRMGPGHTFHVTWLAGETQGASRWVVGLVRQGVAMAWGGGLGGTPRRNATGLESGRSEQILGQMGRWQRDGFGAGRDLRSDMAPGGWSSGEGLGLEVRTEVGPCGSWSPNPHPRGVAGGKASSGTKCPG